MKKKEIIVADTIWYKMRNFFRRIFNLNKNCNDILITNDDSTSFTARKFEKDGEIEKSRNKKLLAEKLMNGEVDISTLSDSDVVEMTEYFKKYIKDMNQRLEFIKRNILKMRHK